MYDHILIPTDGSEHMEPVVERALEFADTYDAKVHALYVVETKATYILTVGLSDEEKREYRKFGEDTVTDVVGKAKARGLEGKGVVKSGRVYEEISEYAEKNDIDAIVMGKRGYGAIDKYIGSTAEKVIRTADIPVLVISP